MADATDTPPSAPPPDLLDTPEAGPRAIRGSLLRLGGYLAGSLLSVLSVSLLVRHLGVEQFGRYVVVISLITIVQGITDGGFAAIGVREFALRDSGARDALMRSLMGIRLLSTSAGVTLAVGFAAVAGYGGTLVAGTVAAGVGLVLTAAQSTLAIPLMAQLRLGWTTGLELLRQVLLVAGIVALAVAGATLLPFLALQIPVAVAVLLATVALVRGTMPLRPSLHVSEWWPLVRDIVPYTAAVAIGSIYLRVTVIAMSLMATELETGYYGTAFRVMEVIVAIPPIVVGATLPILARAARDDDARLEYVLGRLFDAMLLVGLLVGLAVALGAPFAIEVLAGDRADPAIAVLRIQSIAVVAAFVASTWQYGLLSLGRLRAILLYSVVALVAGTALTVALIPPLGAQGAAIAFCASEVTVTVLAAWLLLRAKPDLRISLRIPLRVCAAAAPPALLLLVPGLPSVPATLLGCGLYVGGVLLLRAVPPELLEALGRRRGAAPS